ncbi:hypothetical protein HY947_00815 [Candidatus Gottesmanbacteria bacterium]|nr:hypothetical protein [Candidatus Gottesmanbacteria bacterium]
MGGWVSEYDRIKCDSCNGSGKEKLTKKQKLGQVLLLIVVVLAIIFAISQVVTAGFTMSEPMNLDPCVYCGAIHW